MLHAFSALAPSHFMTTYLSLLNFIVRLVLESWRGRRVKKVVQVWLSAPFETPGLVQRLRVETVMFLGGAQLSLV